MYESLAHLVDEYSKSGMKADNSFVHKVLDIALKERELENYVDRRIIIDEPYTNVVTKTGLVYGAKYLPLEGIYVCTEIINKCIESEFPQFSNLLTKKLLLFNIYNEEFVKKIILYNYNLRFLSIVLGIVEIADKYKNYCCRNDLESVLSDLGIKINIRYAYLKNKLYGNKKSCNLILEKNFNIDNFSVEYFKNKLLVNKYKMDMHKFDLTHIEPVERFSSMRAIDSIKDVICNCDINLEFKNILKYVYDYYEQYYKFFSCYNNKLNPVEEYLRYMQSTEQCSTELLMTDEIVEKVVTYNGNLADRIYHGLEITEFESEQYVKTLKL